MRATATAVVAAALLSGCGTIGGLPPGVPAAAPIAGPSATLLLERTSRIWGFGLAYAVSVDGEPIAELGPGGSATVRVEPGRRTVEVACGGGPFGASDETTATLAAGGTYRFEMYQTLNSGCEIRRAGGGVAATAAPAVPPPPATTSAEDEGLTVGTFED